MKIPFLFFILLFPSFAFCQSEEEMIAEAICANLSKLDLTEASATLNQKALNTIQKVYQDYQPKATKLIESYREKYPNTTDMELTKLIGQEVTVFLMDKCVAYQRITMFGANPVPKISDTAIKIGEEFTDLLSNKMQTQKVSQSLIDDCVMQVIDKYTNLISKTYGDPYDQQFIQEFQAYLMTESMPYIRWMASQIK